MWVSQASHVGCLQWGVSGIVITYGVFQASKVGGGRIRHHSLGVSGITCGAFPSSHVGCLRHHMVGVQASHVGCLRHRMWGVSQVTCGSIFCSRRRAAGSQQHGGGCQGGQRALWQLPSYACCPPWWPPRIRARLQQWRPPQRRPVPLTHKLSRPQWTNLNVYLQNRAGPGATTFLPFFIDRRRGWVAGLPTARATTLLQQFHAYLNSKVKVNLADRGGGRVCGQVGHKAAGFCRGRLVGWAGFAIVAAVG